MSGETVTRVRAGTTTDRYGATVPDWSDPDRRDIPGCAFAPSDGAESHLGGRHAVIVTVTLYVPPGADILPTDRIESRGQAFEVDGEPAAWRSPYSRRERGVALSLRRVDG